MGSERLKQALRHLHEALVPPDGGGLSDGQLLGRFVADREEAAFAVLVRRHGPLVLGVCRRVLGHAQDAEDAFQAAFLVLARKAGSLLKREAVPGFLYKVAYRTALRARARAAWRRATERQVENMPHPEVSPAEAQDWRPLLDRELDRLDEKYRMPVLMCDLEGKTRREAARQLGLAEGTLSSRLATARRMLAKRLARSGLALSGGALAVALAEGATAAVPAALVGSTVKAAALVAAGQTALASPAAVLMKEVLQDMLLTKLKLGVVVVMAGALLAGGGGLAFRASGQVPAPGMAAPAAERRAPGRSLSDLEVLQREMEILKLQVELLQEKVRSLEAQAHSPASPPGGVPGRRRGLGGGGLAPLSPDGGSLPSGAPPEELERGQGRVIPPPAGPGMRGPGPGGPGMGGQPALPGPMGPGGGALPKTPPGAGKDGRLVPPPLMHGAPLGLGEQGGALRRESPPADGARKPPDDGAENPSPRFPPGRGLIPAESVPGEEFQRALSAFRDARGNEARQRAAEKLEEAIKKLRQQLKEAEQGGLPARP